MVGPASGESVARPEAESGGIEAEWSSSVLPLRGSTSASSNL